MTIIVTGAAVFIGSNIVKALNQRGITRHRRRRYFEQRRKNSKTLPSAKSPIISTNTISSARVREHILPYQTSKPFSIKARVPIR